MASILWAPCLAKGMHLSTFLWSQASNREIWAVTGILLGSPRSPAEPGRPGWPEEPRPQASPSLPSQQPSQAGSGRPVDQGQTGRRAGRGESAGTRRKKGVVCQNPTEGPGPQCRGFFREKQTCLSFHQLLLTQPIGFDSLLFHPKQMISK